MLRKNEAKLVFDNGVSARLGVLTKAAQASPPASWSASLDAFSRVSFGANSVFHRTARGTVNDPATVHGAPNNLPEKWTHSLDHETQKLS